MNGPKRPETRVEQKDEAAQAPAPERTSFGKSEYQQAKAFRADAKVVGGMSSPVRSDLVYQKPDGSIWHEAELHLEAPDDDYSLHRSAPAEAVQRVAETRAEESTGSEGAPSVDLAAEEARHIANHFEKASKQ